MPLERSTKNHVDKRASGTGLSSHTRWILSALVLLISAVNIIGGFVVSHRMLSLFCNPGVKDYSWFIVLPGIAISALIVYESEWEEIVGTISGVQF